MSTTDPNSTPPGEAPHERERALRFVQRIHRLRTMGLALGALCVAAVFRLHGAAPWEWGALLVNGFVWPHVAYAYSKRSANPCRAEGCNRLIDSALGGMWVAVMQFNLLPSVLLVTMLQVDKVGSPREIFLVRSIALMAAACALTTASLGFPVDVATPMSVILACTPLLLVYPLAVSRMVIALARKVRHKNRLLEALGRTDGLTGVANRRQCFTVAKAELARHARSGRPAVLIVLDIDRFKSVNDRYGHPVGDDVLCGVATVLRECTRAIDTAGRYGGDEFMIVMPETDLDGAAEVARRIRARLAALTFPGAPDLRCTVSIGAAQAHPGMEDVDLWILEADNALYGAKATGRDRFVGVGSIAGDAPSPPQAP